MAWTNTSWDICSFSCSVTIAQLFRGFDWLVFDPVVTQRTLAFTCCGQIVEPLDQLRKNIAFGHGFLGSQGALSLPALVVAQVIEFVFAIQVEDPWLRTAVLPLRRSSEGAARRSSDLLL